MNSRAFSRQRGSALVEMAIVVPVLAMLMLGVSELGRALYQHNTLNKAVVVGARQLARTYGAVSNDCSEQAAWSAALDRAQNLIVFGHVDGATVTLGDGGQTNNAPVIEGLDDDGLTDIDMDVDAVVLDGRTYCVVRVSIDFEYQPLFTSLFTGGDGLLEFSPFNLYAEARERYLGE